MIAGIFVSTVFFSLQHIHIFQLEWIESFFQGQFVNVTIFGVFAGYFFFKTKGDVWSIFAFHALGNIFSISLPIQITYTLQYAGWLSTISAYIVLFLTLRLMPFTNSAAHRS
jgi:hypothetical protein